MCCRYTLIAPAKLLEELFRLEILGELPPRYNIAPGGPVAAIRAPAAGARELTLFQWGLIPSWSKDPAIGTRLVNARSETAAEKPSFRAAMKRRRCLIPANGFYEWVPIGAAKQPFYIQMKDERPFALAGLWEQWCGADGSEIESCTILTTEANSLLKTLHPRMPVIIHPEDYDRWMDPSNERPQEVQDLLRPFPPEGMEAHPVSRRVNNTRNDDPACMEKVGEEEEQREVQGDLFGG